MKKSVWFRLIFDASWRAAILALPWQTRWFLESAPVAGWPWEFGRISIYVSWFPLIITVLFAFFQPGRSLPSDFRRLGGFVIFLLLLCTLASGPVSISASFQWWIQIGLLIGFFVALYRQRVSFESLWRWIVFALIPHAVLGVWQVFVQAVSASTFLGIAGQHPSDLGVSVIQTSRLRFLRAYGGFPHPNIFGGWMAFGLLSLTVLWMRSAERRPSRHRSVFFLIAFLFFNFGLFFSFSRSAWLAFLIGALSVLFYAWRSGKRYCLRRLRNGTILLGVLFLFFGSFFSELVAIRLGAGDARGLEQRSVSGRIESAVSAWDLFRAYPFFGTGPNGNLPALARLHKSDRALAPLEPPHNVFLLVLTSFGFFGCLVLSAWLAFRSFSEGRCLVLLFFRDRFKDKRFVFLFFLAPLFFLDHYLWTTWSGQFLAGITLLSSLDV